jgi:sugar-specific transcriptional regulator TrmB
MIVKEEFLSKLRRYFNLNLYEVRIWTALLSRGVSTAGELSEIGYVPRSRAYDILESLEKKGFVVMKLGKPIKYLAVDPKEVIERVKQQIQQEADENVMKLRELGKTDILKELEQLHKQGIDFVDPVDLSGAVKGKHNIYAQLETMIKNANKSVTLVTTEKGLIRKVEALKAVMQKLAKKGVKIRIAAPVSKDGIIAIKDLKGIAEVRDAGKLNSRFCVVDSKDLMFMVMHDDDVHPTYDIGIWVNTPFFANSLETMFDEVWKDLKQVK